MTVIYTADVFCDGESCGVWSHGATSHLPPLKSVARLGAVLGDGFIHHSNGKDYCPRCLALMLSKDGPNGAKSCGSRREKLITYSN